MGGRRALVDVHTHAAVVFETRRTVAADAAGSVLTRAATAATGAVERALVDVRADLAVAFPSGATAADIGAVFATAGGVRVTATRVHASTARIATAGIAGVACTAPVSDTAAVPIAGIAGPTSVTGPRAARCAPIVLAGSTAGDATDAFVPAASDDGQNNPNDKPSSSHEGLLESNSLPRVTTLVDGAR
jgi:hypothetical protein